MKTEIETGPKPPPNPEIGDRWLNTDENTVYVAQGGGAWVAVRQPAPELGFVYLEDSQQWCKPPADPVKYAEWLARLTPADQQQVIDG